MQRRELGFLYDQEVDQNCKCITGYIFRQRPFKKIVQEQMEVEREEHMAVKESQCRDEENHLSSKEIGEERGWKIVEGDAEPPLVSSNLLGLKALKISTRMEGCVDLLLTEGNFCC